MPNGKVAVIDDDTVTATQKPIVIDVLSNDDPSATLVAVTKPAHGRVVMINGRVEYQSDPGFIGIDKFVYTVNMASGESFTANVTVNVEGRVLTKSDEGAQKLSLTGANSSGVAAVAIALLSLGLLLVFLGRRRDDEAGE